MINVQAEIARVAGMSVPLLKAEFQQLWGEPARSNNKIFLTKRIVWKLQARDQGDLSARARQRALELGRDAEVRVRPDPQMHAAFAAAKTIASKPPPHPLLAPGSVIKRRYKDRDIEVQVLEQGFQWEGRQFRSLSAVARAVTGSNWNGPLFFNLTPRRAVA